MSHKYPYDDTREALYTPAVAAANRPQPFFDLWDDRDFADDDLLCAEMARLAYATRTTVKDALEAHRFTLDLWIGGETLAERAATLGTDGFVASNAAGRTVVAFRGTESNKPEDILANGFAVAVPWDRSDPSHGHVHGGWARLYGGVRDRLRAVLGERPAPLITGHSLGGALAVLTAADQAARRPTLITFGTPRVGDAAFAERLAGLTVRRFVDCCDLVTRVPPERLDRQTVADLLDDLVTHPLAKLLVPAVARALSTTLLAVGVRFDYVHVGALQYRDRTGRGLAAGTTAQADQRAARAAYHGHVVPEIEEVLAALASAVAAATEVDGLLEAIRNAGRALFQGGRVPLRDLADHAPINYVSLFTGRE